MNEYEITIRIQTDDNKPPKVDVKHIGDCACLYITATNIRATVDPPHQTACENDPDGELPEEAAP